MPLKQPEKSVTSKSPLTPASQVQGLGDLAKAPHEVPSGCCRKWIKETHSAYIRLAKRGGRPDLLKHYTPVTRRTSPAAYAVPDWYSHRSSPPVTNEPWSSVSSLQGYTIHRKFKADVHHGNSYELRRGPFDMDVQSVWQWDAEDKEKTKKKKVKLPAINPKYPSRMPTVSTNKEFSGKNKLSFPPMSAQKKTEAVSFSKLISNGYGTDWFHQCAGWEKKIQETSENSEQSKDSEPSQSESSSASNKSKATVSRM
ncbi:uncharacterized protein C7orf57 homolog [Phalacrocorax aristotelis]|uniref:uncharacterized protein C7orf57 homolog n=1 Tax=Phalacrocorax aristotelis TaxID=126867 RepID=UPI003F4C6FE6